MSIDVNETVADLQATVDYLRMLAEQSDSMEFDAAAAVNDELARVKHEAGVTIGLLSQRMLERLEAQQGPRQFGTRVFTRVREYKERHDHDKIASTVYAEAVMAATGEEGVDWPAAVKQAVHMMRKAYTSRSTKAKVTVLGGMGLGKSQYESREFTGWGLNVTETDPQ